MAYVLYATNKDGDGHVQVVGRFENIEDIIIRVGMYADDVVLELTHEYEKEDDSDDYWEPKEESETPIKAGAKEEK